MANPLFQNNKGEDANRASNPLNDADKTYRQKSNLFDFDRTHYTTMSYADITPFEHVYGIGGDTLKFGSKHHLRTYTLQSPMFDKLFIKKSYYMTDMRAILPINWEKIFREPSVGDDIPNDLLNTYVEGDFFLRFLNAVFNHSNMRNPFDSHFANFFPLLLIVGDIFSSSGLLARFGINQGGGFLGRNIPVVFTDGQQGYVHSFDEWFEIILSQFNKYWNNDVFYLFDKVNSVAYYSSDSSKMTFVQALELSRYQDRFEFRLEDELPADISMSFSLFASFVNDLGGREFIPCNYAPVIAYQLVCAEYFTNDQIDNVYSSQLWHQNQRGLLSRVGSSSDSFIYNGVPTLYDSVSGYYLERIISFISSTVISSTEQSNRFNYAVGYLSNIFSMNKSLRYGDYFTGARPEAYSPIDKTSEVVDGSVSAIDITRSILSQRFSNAVARTGRRFSDYLVEITDGYDVPDVEVPRWLASKSSPVDGFEVENTTSQNQGNIVTILNSKNSDYIYSLDVGSPCVVIGVCTFSMERVYTYANDKFAFHKNRYDMFNKFMQFDGDQPLLAKELLSSFEDDYAYQLRHMEYKQRYNIASGGWLHFLPPMFVQSSPNYYYENSLNEYHIDFVNIRNSNSDFDAFYSSLTGFSPSARFHFLVKFENYCSAKRKMARQPSIL